MNTIDIPATFSSFSNLHFYNYNWQCLTVQINNLLFALLLSIRPLLFLCAIFISSTTVSNDSSACWLNMTATHDAFLQGLKVLRNQLGFITNKWFNLSYHHWHKGDYICITITCKLHPVISRITVSFWQYGNYDEKKVSILVIFNDTHIKTRFLCYDLWTNLIKHISCNLKENVIQFYKYINTEYISDFDLINLTLSAYEMLLVHNYFFKLYLFYVSEAVCKIIQHLFTVLILLASFMG